MHIALVNQWYPPVGGFGGTSIYTATVAEMLSGMGHDVTVLTSGQPDTRLGPHLRVRGIRRLGEPWWSYRVPLAGRYFRAGRLAAYSCEVSVALAAIHRRHPIDVVEFPEVNAEGFAYLKRRHRAPVVVRCHTPHLLLEASVPEEQRTFDFASIWALERSTIRAAEFVTAPSNDLRALMIQRAGIAPDNALTVPNPIQASAYAGVPPEPKCPPITVLHVGRIEARKGVRTLVRALAAAMPSCPSLHLRLAGAGPPGEVDEIRVLAAELGIGERVSLLGFVPQADLLGEYARSHICVVPAEMYESYSYTAAQAMAAGRPVIASRIGGIPETIGQDAGILVEPGDTAAFTEAMVTLGSSSEARLAMGRAGRSRSCGALDVKVVAGRLLEVYERAMLRRASSSS